MALPDIDVVPGTHASSSFLAYLAFNQYVLDTPLYRELVRMMDEQIQVSCMTLTNWLEKGCKYVNGLIKILKDHCLDKDSIFFGSGKMAGVSAAYHTIISTCKLQGISALQYFKMFFREIVNGRRDYENLLPITIGLSNNKL